MTWFRAGGAGIPASLKNNMNSVLNKKFGTTGQNYPPNGWPDDVNLLGPLPENTVAGAIASFDDGADDVPISDGVFSIVPKQEGSGTPSLTNVRPVSGYSGMNIYQTGKNLLHNEMVDGNTGGVDYSLNSDGSIDCSGTVSNVNSTRSLATNVRLPVGSYVLSGADSSINLRCVVYAKDGTSANRNDTGSGVTVSITDDTDYIEFRVKARTNAEVVNSTIYPMFEVGSTPSQFEAYKAKTPIVDTFGRTIYGGSRGTDGTLAENWEKLTFDGSDDENWTTGVVGTYRRTFFTTTLKSNTAYATDILGENIEISTSSENQDKGMTCRSTNYSSNRLYVFVPLSDTSITDVATFKTWLSNNPITIAYKYTTPNEYQIDPISISSFLGSNNIYTDIDGGQTQITYRQDIALALAALQGSRSLSASLMRSGSPEEVSEPEENIQNTEETEGESDER